MISTGGRSTGVTFSGMAPLNAGETSPAQVGLIPLTLPGPGAEAAAMPSAPPTPRNVSDNLPSSVATLIFSA